MYHRRRSFFVATYVPYVCTKEGGRRCTTTSDELQRGANRVTPVTNLVKLRMFLFLRCVSLVCVSPSAARKGYSASAYLASKILAEIPTDGVFPLIFGTT